MLGRLRGLGLASAIDDFRAGYSSLAYLKGLPVQELKIGKGFVRHPASDPTDVAIVACTVGLGHALSPRVVAEGVERWDWRPVPGKGDHAAPVPGTAAPAPRLGRSASLGRNGRRAWRDILS